VTRPSWFLRLCAESEAGLTGRRVSGSSAGRAGLPAGRPDRKQYRPRRL